MSDGIVITPSHHPPECSGFKYNPPHGGPAEERITTWIEASANGAGVHYWEPVAERYGLNLKVANNVVDPMFRFMTLDWDGRICMDPSSASAMRALLALKDQFDLCVACDTDHDRHGIVTKSGGLLSPNH